MTYYLQPILHISDSTYKQLMNAFRLTVVEAGNDGAVCSC